MKRKKSTNPFAVAQHVEADSSVAAAPRPEPDYAPGDRLTVTIEDIAFGGEGVARANHFVIFVPFVAPGERVVVELTELKRRFARGRSVEILDPSPHRVTPRCPVFGECGGCQYQHLDYSIQLEIKQKQIRDLLERIGGLDPDAVAPVVACPTPYYYRNRIMVRSQWNREKRDMNVGFLRFDNRLVVDVEECHIAEPVLNRELGKIRLNPPRKNGVKVVLRVFPDDWFLPRDSFFQNNFHLLPGLVQAVAGRLRASEIRHLIDAYCGVGFFSLELASHLASFVGIEIDRMAIQAARENAVRRGVTNGEFIEARTEDALPDLLKKLPADQTGILLDPPRRGCDPDGLALLARVRPRQILYVSCHPATLARDLARLAAEGKYRLEKLIPLDMFPQTQHVECVADLRRVDA